MTACVFNGWGHGEHGCVVRTHQPPNYATTEIQWCVWSMDNSKKIPVTCLVASKMVGSIFPTSAITLKAPCNISISPGYIVMHRSQHRNLMQKCYTSYGGQVQNWQSIAACCEWSLSTITLHPIIIFLNSLKLRFILVSFCICISWKWRCMLH